MRLVAHDPQWEGIAVRESERLLATVPALLAVHHIGSTAIPAIVAKPVIDLLGECVALATFDDVRPAVEALGYLWRGEYGLPGRRYCVRDDLRGERLVHLHCYASGSPDIVRHLAFRDRLCGDPALAAEYGRLKARCAIEHGGDAGPMRPARMVGSSALRPRR